MKKYIAFLFLSLLIGTLSFADTKPTIVDVREWDEIKKGMIKDAVWLPLSEVELNSPDAQKRIGKLEKKSEIQLYCKSGRRAGKVGEILEKQGFTVKNLGGYDDLKKNGLPTVIPPKKPEPVI